MKTLDLEITKQMVTTIRVLVPDDFNPEKLYGNAYGRMLYEVATGMRYGGEWDLYDRRVEVEDITAVEDGGDDFVVEDICARIADLERKEQPPCPPSV